MADVAREAGVSRYSVSKVLNGDVSVKAETKRKVLAAGKKLQYERNHYATNLVRKETRTIGMIVSQITDTFFGEIISAAEREAHQHQYDFAYECSYEDPHNEARIIRHFQSLKVCGIIATPVVSELNMPIWNRLEHYLPIIYVDRYLKEDCHFIVNDNYTSARLVTEHLLASGRVPAYLGSAHTPLNRAIHDRNRGYVETVKAHGHAPLIVPRQNSGETADNYQFGFENMMAYLGTAPPPPALFCATDRIALGAMSALSHWACTVGRDILVAGHDDLEFSAYTLPSLTTIRQPKLEMGRAAVQGIVDLKTSKRASKKMNKVFQSNLIIRDSTCPRRRVNTT